jgi:hypothetical protein
MAKATIYLAAATYLLHAMFSSQIDPQKCEHEYNSEEKRSLNKFSSILSESHAQRIYYLLCSSAQPLNSEIEQTENTCAQIIIKDKTENNEFQA